MKKFWFFPVAAILLGSCSDSTSSSAKKGEYVSAIAAGEDTDEARLAELKRIEEAEKARLAAVADNITTLSFDKLRHDFGDVLPDTDNTTQFTVTNTGKRPLIVEKVQASCGCTTPKKPEKPIPPGESDVIEVTFHPKPGQKNEIIKTVSVTGNTDPKVNTLTIRAFVKGDE